VGKQIERVPAATKDRLIAYEWPDNIRELRNVLERALVLSPGPVLLLEELGESLKAAVPAPTAGGGSRAFEDDRRRAGSAWPLYRPQRQPGHTNCTNGP
jgi:formate hydrogenlyase transcriptional activator